MWLKLVLLGASILAADPPAGDGTIEGVVVRAADQSPVAGAEVILRARVGGQLATVAETTADAQGRFCFSHLAADGDCLYLPGANRDGIHYPGTNVRLSAIEPHAEVTLTVHDAVTFPNPPVVRRHEIVLRPQSGALEVTESMLVDNPSSACYVGQAAGENAEPVTLQLAIPAGFERVTFATEFFGRRFALIGGKLATSVPWPPGQRELKFSYLLPNAQRHYVWQRPLDLSTAQLRVSVCGGLSDEVVCNLPAAAIREDGAVSFEAKEPLLSAGYPLRVELGHLPISVMAYAPWLALTTLVGLVLATCVPRMPLRWMRRGAVNSRR
jgi:hypothetical protein